METTKLLHLANILRSTESVLVAFSGGVDSTFLLKVALDTLSERVLAVTAESPTFPAWQLREAKKLAKDMGAKLEFIRSEELANPKFVNNN